MFERSVNHATSLIFKVMELTNCRTENLNHDLTLPVAVVALAAVAPVAAPVAWEVAMVAAATVAAAAAAWAATTDSFTCPT